MTLGPLPLWLSPSLLYSFHGRSALLAGRKTRCFDAGSRDQREALPEGCVDPAEKHHRLAASTSKSSSLLKELGLRDYSCVSECVSDSDGMAHFERSERGGRPAHWRRRQQRWSGTDHAQNDNRLSGLHNDGFRTVHRPLHPSIQRDGHAAALDELVLKHMADDCTSVKSQLLKLHSLLQMEDDEITPEILDISEDERKAQQMEEMMKEVAHLREELKKKDQIITQLTHHQQQESSVRCQCLHQKCGVKGERRTHHDKSTQTAWRPPHHHHAPQILQPISHIPNDSLIQGRVARTAPTGDRSDACPPRERSPASHLPAPLTSVVTSPAPRMAGVPHKQSRSQPDPEELSQLLSTHLRIQDNRESDSQQNGEHIVRPTPHNRPNQVQSMSLSFFSPPVLQGPRLHRRFTLSALPQGVATEANPKLAPNALNAKQLPPPSGGLPCVSSRKRDRSLGVLSRPGPTVVRRETVPNLGGGSEARPGSALNHSAKPLPPPSRGLQCVSSAHNETLGVLSHVKKRDPQ